VGFFKHTLLNMQLNIKELANQNQWELYIGNLMMLGLEFLGQVLIILEDGNHYNLWRKDFILILQFFIQIKKALQ